MKGLLPPIDSEDWEYEKEFFLNSNVEARRLRALRLGFKNYKSYKNAMSSRNVSVPPDSPFNAFDSPVVIKEPALLIFDTQIPYQDSGFLFNVLSLARSWGIKQGISGGDLFNMTAFSGFYEAPNAKVFSIEKKVANEMLTALSSYIPNWLLVKGNHEHFLIRKLESQMDMEDIMKVYDAGKCFTSTDYYYCILELAGTKWRITHPRNTSIMHGRVPNKLCNKYHMNIVSGHGHLAGAVFDDSGEYVAIDAGVTCDPMRLDYYAYRDSTRPAMNRGAVIINLGLDGKAHYYHLLPSSDWEALKRLYRKQ